MPCLNKSIFGIDCMGCGLQRSLFQLSQGNFLKAFEMFPAVYTSLLFFVLVVLHFTDTSRNYLKFLVSTAIINALIMVLAYIYKMRFLFF